MKGVWDRPPIGTSNPAEIAGLIVLGLLGVAIIVVAIIVVVGIGFMFGWQTAVVLSAGLGLGLTVGLAIGWARK
jgi:hypothetical protein